MTKYASGGPEQYSVIKQNHYEARVAAPGERRGRNLDDKDEFGEFWSNIDAYQSIVGPDPRMTHLNCSIMP